MIVKMILTPRARIGFLLFAALGSWQLALLGSLFTFTAFRWCRRIQCCNRLIASAVAGLSLLCRYAGFALVASGLFAVLFLGARERRDKFTDALVFAGMAV